MATERTAFGQELNRNQMIMVGALFLVLFLVILFMFILPGGDDADDTAAPVAAAPSPVVTPEVVESPADPGDGPVETFEVFARRDPFEPVVDTSSGGDGAAPTGGTSGETATDPANVGDTGDTGGSGDGSTGGSGDGTGSSGDGSGDGSGTGSGTGSSGNDSSNVGGHRVKLIDVYKKNGSERAQVQVDGTVYTVREGEDFAENFRLLSISGECASMLFGDDQFTICEGEEILK